MRINDAQPQLEFVTQLSRDEDLTHILGWLRKEWDANGRGEGFWCNRSIIEEAHVKKELHVLISQTGGSVVGFIVGGFASIEIIEIHPEHRRRGLGALFVKQWMIARKARGEFGILVDCISKESLQFAVKLGFVNVNRVYPSCSGHTRAAYSFPMSMTSATGTLARDIQVIIRENDVGQGDILMSFKGVAYSLGSDTWRLSERFAGYVHDPCKYISIILDGLPSVTNKIKYLGSMGVEFRNGFFRIDKIYLNAQSTSDS